MEQPLFEDLSDGVINNNGEQFGAEQEPHLDEDLLMGDENQIDRLSMDGPVGNNEEGSFELRRLATMDILRPQPLMQGPQENSFSPLSNPGRAGMRAPNRPSLSRGSEADHL